MQIYYIKKEDILQEGFVNYSKFLQYIFCSSIVLPMSVEGEPCRAGWFFVRLWNLLVPFSVLFLRILSFCVDISPCRFVSFGMFFDNVFFLFTNCYCNMHISYGIMVAQG